MTAQFTTSAVTLPLLLFLLLLLSPAEAQCQLGWNSIASTCSATGNVCDATSTSDCGPTSCISSGVPGLIWSLDFVHQQASGISFTTLEDSISGTQLIPTSATRATTIPVLDATDQYDDPVSGAQLAPTTGVIPSTYTAVMPTALRNHLDNVGAPYTIVIHLRIYSAAGPHMPFFIGGDETELLQSYAFLWITGGNIYWYQSYSSVAGALCSVAAPLNTDIQVYLKYNGGTSFTCGFFGSHLPFNTVSRVLPTINTAYTTIGYNYNFQNFYEELPGRFYSVRIYNRGLTQVELDADRLAGPPQNALVSGGRCGPSSLWTVDPCSSNQYGPNCATCPNCGAGSCNSGINGDGTCTCPAFYRGTGTTSCTPCNAATEYGASCAACPSCGAGSCDSGLAGSGTCNCPPFYRGDGTNTCTACDASSEYGPGCASCPNCGDGTCDSGLSGSGTCDCPDFYEGDGTNSCTACDPLTEYGPNCDPCPQCLAGAICFSGLAGNGTCVAGECPGDNQFGFACLPCPECRFGGTCRDGPLGDGLCDCPEGFTGTDTSSCEPIEDNSQSVLDRIAEDPVLITVLGASTLCFLSSLVLVYRRPQLVRDRFTRFTGFGFGGEKLADGKLTIAEDKKAMLGLDKTTQSSDGVFFVPESIAPKKSQTKPQGKRKPSDAKRRPSSGGRRPSDAKRRPSSGGRRPSDAKRQQGAAPVRAPPPAGGPMVTTTPMAAIQAAVDGRAPPVAVLGGSSSGGNRRASRASSSNASGSHNKRRKGSKGSKGGGARRKSSVGSSNKSDKKKKRNQRQSTGGASMAGSAFTGGAISLAPPSLIPTDPNNMDADTVMMSATPVPSATRAVRSRSLPARPGGPAGKGKKIRPPTPVREADNKGRRRAGSEAGPRRRGGSRGRARKGSKGSKGGRRRSSSSRGAPMPATTPIRNFRHTGSYMGAPSIGSAAAPYFSGGGLSMSHGPVQGGLPH